MEDDQTQIEAAAIPETTTTEIDYQEVDSTRITRRNAEWWEISNEDISEWEERQRMMNQIVRG